MGVGEVITTQGMSCCGGECKDALLVLWQTGRLMCCPCTLLCRCCVVLYCTVLCFALLCRPDYMTTLVDKLGVQWPSAMRQLTWCAVSRRAALCYVLQA